MQHTPPIQEGCFQYSDSRESAKAFQQPAHARASNEVEEPLIHDVFHPGTSTWQYVVACPTTSVAAIVDPVLDFDPASCAISTKSADSLLSWVSEKGYQVKMILETHAHADHLTAASYLQDRIFNENGVRPPIGIGKRIQQVQRHFGKMYGIDPEEYEGAFDKLFQDDEVFEIGGMEAIAIHLPGHTPDHMGYMIGGKLSSGTSFLHAADVGTSRQCLLW